MKRLMLPILMYHGLHANGTSRGRFDPVYSVKPGDFERQLDWLCANGYCSVRLDDIAVRGADKRIVISFDDGDISNREIALPLLIERGMVAEFFITTDFIGQPGMLAADDVGALVAAGMGVQSHGRTHRFLEDLDRAALDSELIDSKCRLESLGSTPVDALALPGGRGGEREREAAMLLGYRHVLTSVPGVNRGRRSGDSYERIAVTRELPLEDFAALVQWRGLRPRMARLRYRALALPKRMLGNDRYQKLRAGLLAR